MQSLTDQSSQTAQYATFYCGKAVLGLDIQCVQEINRTTSITRVPLSPPCVRGVMNLRGEVVTMLDLRTLMGLPPAECTKNSRNLILKFDGEIFGLWVDGVADILAISEAEISAPPSNISIADSRMIRGVYQQEGNLVMLVNPAELLAVSLSMTRSSD